MYTTEGGPLPNRLAVDGVVAFSSSFGTEYSGLWIDCYNEEQGRNCRALRITIVDSRMPIDPANGEPIPNMYPPIIGRTLAWIVAPNPDLQPNNQPNNWGGVKSASGISEHSTSVITLGQSVHSEAEPMHPVLDLGQSRLLFLQRTHVPGGLTSYPPRLTENQIYARSTEFTAKASSAHSDATRVVNGGDGSGHHPQPYGANSGMYIRQCSLLTRSLPQASEIIDGVIVRIGSCNNSNGGSMQPIHLTAGHLHGGGCGAGGVGCGISIELSTVHPTLVRPPGAPIEGNTSVNILGYHLASVRLCQFHVPGLGFNMALSMVEPFNGAGFRCQVPPINTSLLWL